MLVELDFWTISSSQETSIIAILMKDVSKNIKCSWLIADYTYW